MLVLTEKDLKELNSFIQDLPLKYGYPLLNFINGKISEQVKQQSQESSEEVTEEEIKP